MRWPDLTPQVLFLPLMRPEKPRPQQCGYFFRIKIMKQPDLHMAGWPELPFHGRAKTDGTIYWWEERMEDGSIKRHPCHRLGFVMDELCQGCPNHIPEAQASQSIGYEID